MRKPVNKLAAGMLVVVGLMLTVAFAKTCRRPEDRVNQIREDAKRELLREAPIGTPFESAVDVLKKQSYDSDWKLDADSRLTAVKRDVLNEFTLRTGPTSWQLNVYCDFVDSKLSDVQTDMWPTGL